MDARQQPPPTFLVQVLGEVRCGTGPGAGKEQAILGCLAANRGRPISASRLLELCWGSAGIDRSRSLITLISRLRSWLPPESIRYDTVGGGYVLDLPAESCDAWWFEDAVTRSTKGEARLATLRAALGVWARSVVPFNAFDNELTDSYIHRLTHLRELAILEIGALEISSGVSPDSLDELQAAFDDAPERGDFAGILARCFSRADQQLNALRILARHRAALVDRGLVVAPELALIETSILRHEIDRVGRVPLPTDIPTTPNVFIGRADELDDLAESFSRSALVTMTGPGGVGKTRLAAVYARLVKDSGVDTRFISLTEVETDVLSVIAAALGVNSNETDTQAALIEYLQHRETFLVLDNCEHVHALVREVVQGLLAHCVGLRLLCTSRRRLESAWELVVDLAPLSLPQAVGLLLARVPHRLGETRQLDQQLIEAAVDRLDRLPLAIELAASRAATTSTAAVVRELADSSRDPGIGGLASSIDRSLALLDQPTRQALARLSVIAGDFDVAAAAAIAATTEQHIAQVLDDAKELSLISMVTTSDSLRYRFFETVRSCISVGTDSATLETARQRHADHYRQHVAQLGLGLWDEREAAASAALRTALPQIRSAFEWAMSTGSTEVAIELAESMAFFGHTRLVHDVSRWAERVISRFEPTIPPSQMVSLLGLTAASAWFRGDFDDAQHATVAAQRLCIAHNIPKTVHVANVQLALSIGDKGNFPLIVETTQAAEREPALFWQVNVEVLLVLGASSLGFWDVANTCARKAARAATASANATIHSWVSLATGVLGLRDSPENAIISFETGEGLALTCGSDFLQLMNQMYLVSALRLAGRHADALHTLQAILPAWLAARSYSHVGYCFREAALLFDHFPDTEDARRRCLAASEAITAALPALAGDRSALDSMREALGLIGLTPPAPPERLMGTGQLAIDTARRLTAKEQPNTTSDPRTNVRHNPLTTVELNPGETAARNPGDLDIQHLSNVPD